MNRLQYETSPYLLQHAQNPVDWYPWGEEALALAKQSDKPILVSIGYSTCHWCHVMERESFEDESVASFMNENFINIKIDREERPDLDQIYMDACQAMQGHGGWPLNCFLLPDGKPFYAGTYFPPKPIHNRPSWMNVLQRVQSIFFKNREIAEEQAQRLIDMMHRSDRIFLKDAVVESVQSPLNEKDADEIFEKLASSFDHINGGFGRAPKFPGTMSLQYLLHYHYLTGSAKALDHATFSLQKMIDGGIYDQIGGGFARYATDAKWLVPHFEKMLYDNALLVQLLSEAYKVTKNGQYARTIKETLSFIEREMTSPEGGFFAALDADSEGVEGKFYVWDKAEIEACLGENAAFFMEAFGVTNGGNWEGVNILNRPRTFELFANTKGMTVEELERKLEPSKQKLLDLRAKRIRPGLDDKIMLNWNALQCQAYISAYAALGIPAYKEVAIRNMAFLEAKFKRSNDGGLYHTYKNGEAKINAYIDDYANLIAALIDLYEITFNTQYLDAAVLYCRFAIKNFLDEETKLFYFTEKGQSDLPVRRKGFYDASVPSGNAMMMFNLLKLQKLTGDQEYLQHAMEVLIMIKDSVIEYPSSFSKWASCFLFQAFTSFEIAVVGEDFQRIGEEINSRYLPQKVLMASADNKDGYPLLKDRKVEGKTKIYACRDFACEMPEETVEAILDKITPGDFT